jgi:hypothetical protein
MIALPYQKSKFRIRNLMNYNPPGDYLAKEIMNRAKNSF